MKNKILEVRDDHVVIELGSKYRCMVDIVDVEAISNIRWCVHWNNKKNSMCVASSANGRCIRMHRMLLGVTDKKVIVDHKNGNQLDNRRKNLRPANFSQNSGNSKRPSNNKSGYKGVTWNKECGKWQAQIRLKDRHPVLGWGYLGLYEDLTEAARKYDLAACYVFGEFACLNFEDKLAEVYNARVSN